MIKQMNFGMLHFSVTFAVFFALTRDPWLSGLASLIAPLLNLVAGGAAGALNQRLFRPELKPCRIRSTDQERRPRDHVH
ncbi:DUF2061 domain-containing protein [Halotalea alkalilenta]|uniref:DUF2061 domain-containing protein n=1 Tax=Halotalea alkalilenta TaxID=376489 RepID=A0A172YFL6_9GAMM|nr:DUF2061 domain-containing protein [Halotalea alkalilenta]ANF57862.1 hypothetical protein A5892_10625 [Halotalea alkalilenta]